MKYPSNPEAYELRLTDDDVEDYTPNREISALDRNSALEEFPGLALIEIWNYKAKDSSPKKQTELQLA